MDKKTLGVLALIFTAIIWGATLPLLKTNLNQIPPLTIGFVRFLIAAVLAVSFSEVNNLKIKDIFHIGVFAIFGITLNTGLLLVGLQKTTAVDATLIMTLSPVITSSLAVVLLSERINTGHFSGIIAAFLGSFLYVVFPHLGGSGLNFDLSGDLLVLAAVLSGSIYVLGSKKLFETYKPATIAAVSFLVGMVSFFPGALLEYVHNSVWVEQISWYNIVSLLFLGVFSSFAAYFCLEWGLTIVEVHVNSAISYLSPLVSVVVATAFLGETLNSAFVPSTLLIVVGIFLVTKHRPNLHPHFHKRTHRI